jgi:ribosomal RNA small subunit methyltransferase RsmB
LDILLKVEQKGAFSNIALSNSLGKSQLSKRDKAFVTNLVQGVLRNRSALDETIQSHSKRPVDKLPAVLLNTLRLAIYQLKFLDDMPPSAILNTSTSLAREAGHDGLAKYTTAVLRNYLRAVDKSTETGAVGSDEKDSIDGKELEAASLSKRYSMPEWLVDRWLKNYGADQTKKLLSFAQSEPIISLRTNETAITVDGLMSVFEGAGITVRRSELVESCLIIADKGKFRGGLEKLPGYGEGLFSIQDESAAFVSMVVDPKEKELIIDLCAAPGGKTLHMSELMQGTGKIIAVDKHEKRLEYLKENRRRLSLTNIELATADGTTFQFERQADRVLVDAPCTGTGVINRKSDIRYRREAEDIESLQKIQVELLNNAATLVKPGGVLVYSTCSIEPEENERVIEKFMEHNLQFQKDDLSSFVPNELAGRWNLTEQLKSGQVQLLPTMDGQSGFLFAV